MGRLNCSRRSIYVPRPACKLEEEFRSSWWCAVCVPCPSRSRGRPHIPPGRYRRHLGELLLTSKLPVFTYSTLAGIKRIQHATPHRAKLHSYVLSTVRNLYTSNSFWHGAGCCCVGCCCVCAWYVVKAVMALSGADTAMRCSQPHRTSWPSLTWQ